MADVVADLERAFEGLSSEESIAKLKGLELSSKSADAIKVLIGNSEAIRGFEESIRAAGGTTQDVADNQFTSLSRATNNLGAAMDELTAKNGLFLEGSAAIVNVLAEQINNLNELSKLADDIVGSLGDIGDFGDDGAVSEAFGDAFSLGSNLFGNLIKGANNFIAGNEAEKKINALQIAIDAKELAGTVTDLDRSNLIDAKIAKLEATKESLEDSPLSRFFITDEELAAVDHAIDQLRQQQQLFKDIAPVELPPPPEIADDPVASAADAAIDAEAQRMERRAEALAQSVRTPFEVLEDQFADLNNLLDVGAINATTYSRALDQQVDKFKSTQAEARKLAQSSRINIQDSIGVDSKEAFELIFGKRTGDDPGVVAQKEGNKLNEDANALLARIEAALRGDDAPAQPVIEVTEVNW